MTAKRNEASLITVEAALQTILSTVTPLPPLSVSLLEAQGHILAEAVCATENIPPFRNSAMDGYAVQAADLLAARPNNPVYLRVIADGPAGYPPRGTVIPGTAIRIMTGAPLPPGADTVVRFEETDEQHQSRGWPTAQLGQPVRFFRSQPPWINVREAGEDIRAGSIVLTPGTLLRPVELGILASLGYAAVLVHRPPTVAIIATGDEVVDLGQTPQPGQIRNSNSYTLAALVQRYGGIPRLLGVARDTRADLTAMFAAASTADLILSSGGVSVGDYDIVKDVLGAEGEIALWQVQMKPGRPLAYGQLHDKPFLGLPGNPVAAYVSFELFARPIILRQLGYTHLAKPTLTARVTEPIENRGGRRHYVRAIVTNSPTGPTVRPTGEQGSGVLTAIMRANGLLIIPDGCESLATGDEAEVLLLHQEQTTALATRSSAANPPGPPPD